MRVVLEGAIAGAAFSSGDAFVVGLWDSGPLGAMADVMWTQPSGRRVLLAPDERVAAFVSGVYSFDETVAVSFAVTRWADGFELSAGELRLMATLSRPHPLFALRPRRLRRSLAWVRVEDALLRPVVGRFVIGGGDGVRMRGKTPGGQREWYRIDGYRRVLSATARLGGRDLGPLAPLAPDLGFGFSGFPRHPAFVACSPVLDGVDGRLVE